MIKGLIRLTVFIAISAVAVSWVNSQLTPAQKQQASVAYAQAKPYASALWQKAGNAATKELNKMAKDNTAPTTVLNSAPAAADPLSSYNYSSSDLAAGVAIWTDPEFGAVNGKTERWTKKNVTYSITTQSGVDNSLVIGEIANAIKWDTAATGVTFQQVPSGGDMEFRIEGTVYKNGRSVGGLTTTTSEGSAITHDIVEINALSIRAAWEETTQAMGPLGDHTPEAQGIWDSGATANTVERPTAFNAWVMRAGYSVPAGSTAATVKKALENTK